MTEPYLILHKVRGEPAFDVATQLRCPVCDSTNVERRVENASSCHACKGTSLWWIIPTSGHRAYPCWHIELSKLGWREFDDPNDDWKSSPRSLPQGEIELLMLISALPDHYACNDTPKPKPTSRPVPTTDDFLI